MGVIALHYAAEHPEKVEAVVLHDYMDMNNHPASTAMGEIAAVDWQLYVDTTARTGWPQFDPSTIRRMLFDAMTQADHILQRKAIAAVSGEALMKRIQVPVLFLAARSGSRPLSAEETTRRWAANLPESRLVFFDDAAGPFSRAAVDTIDRFLAELDERIDDDSPVSRARPVPFLGEAARLTPREHEVLFLIASGRSNQQIADELVLSLRTVERHITNLYAKIGAHGKADATAYALRHGIE
jgi:DNA-binding CsgD family transcriptional regulator